MKIGAKYKNYNFTIMKSKSLERDTDAILKERIFNRMESQAEN